MGSHFIEYLLKNGIYGDDLDIIVVDTLTYAGNPASLEHLDKSFITVVQENVKNTELMKGLIQGLEVELIVHFAAETHVDRSLHWPGTFFETNTMGTISLLEAIREIKLMRGKDIRFHYVSTDEVYGNTSEADSFYRSKEHSPFCPSSPYSASKAAADLAVQSYYRTFGLPVTISRPCNNFGERQFPEKFIPHVILQAKDYRPIPIYGDGLQERDWVYAQDCAEMIFNVIKYSANGSAYNVGVRSNINNLNLAKKICRIVDELMPDASKPPRESFIQMVADRPGHDRRYASSYNRLQANADLIPIDFDTALRSTVRWYLEEPTWLQSALARPEMKEWLKRNYEERK